MTIREITQTMLWNILVSMNSSSYSKKRATSKQIAEKIGITQSALSRLSTGAATPNVDTWMKICALHRQMRGDMETAALLDAYENVL